MQDKILTQLHNKLLHQGKTVAIAESCTGGLLCSTLTKNPGASAYLLLGVVAYSNKAKEKILQIPTSLISKYGAVSSQVAKAMARNIRKIARTDLGIGITGLAGPQGSTINKPIGMVFICLSVKNKKICREFSFRGSRQDIQKKAVREALRLLCAHLSL